VLMNVGALKGAESPGEDIALHLMPGFTGIMPASEFERMVKAQADAEAAKAPPGDAKPADGAAVPTPLPPGMPGVSG